MNKQELEQLKTLLVKFQEDHNLELFNDTERQAVNTARSIVNDYIMNYSDDGEPEWYELDIWTDNLERFRLEFGDLNDVKFENQEVVDVQGVDKHYSLVYRKFDDNELVFPEQGYYQLRDYWKLD